MQDVFDDFCLEEMQILTGARLEVNGHRNISWYDADEREKGLTEYIRWKEIREIAFMYIKGRKTPQSFVILHDSHVISPCSVTVSVHDQPRDQCMICHMISV